VAGFLAIVQDSSKSLCHVWWCSTSTTCCSRWL